MSDSEYDEENLDDFLVKAASVLTQENHPEKETIYESLKHHLASIFPDQSEMENFFKTLNAIIFTTKSKKNSQKIQNKLPFKLYPLVFSFNPKTSFFYVDYYLMSLQLCASEENRPEFPYLSAVFSEVIKAFFSDENDNKNLIKKNYVLDHNKQAKLYDKLLNFCNSNIKTNKKTEQSFGCLLLTEFLEKCPLSKEEKHLENLFKIILEYLDDRWFECKLDLLNCTISLIFTGEKKSEPFANKCLFKVLDYLSDEEWMKRKLAVNIIYTLLFYCKDEVLTMKDSIIDFLTPLKNDPVKEVKEVCLQTLNFLKDCDPHQSDAEEELVNEIGDLGRDRDENERGDSSQKNKSKNASSRNVQNLSVKIQKEKRMLDRLEKAYNEKKNNFNNSRKKNKRSERGEETPEKNETIDSVEKRENLNDKFGLTLYNISQQLKKVQEEHDELNNMFEEVRQIIDNNYTSLNERLKNLENKATYNPKKMNSSGGGKKVYRKK